ncbi:MAG: IclR family transcriptional regulator [Provencibacterium sp.]|jgi:DNA-binding IclR family transcriptional regulator|nr:IclR family transcriptional regulator [Provencibacterium sp.]
MFAMQNGTPVEKKLTRSNQSSEKLLLVLEKMAELGQPLRLQDIAQSAGLNPSTALRFVGALERRGYVYQDPQTQRYCTTMKICVLSNRVLANMNNNVRDLSRSILRNLSCLFGEAACMSVEQDMQALYTDIQDGPDQILRSTRRIGSIAPLHCTGAGKLMLTNYSSAELDHYIESKGLPRFTSRTLCTREELAAELENIRRQGYACDNEECELGVRCVAVASRDDTGRVSHCFSVTGPCARLTDDKIQAHLPTMCDMAYRLSRLLGYSGSRADWPGAECP